MADPAQWVGLIRSMAPKYGLDPNAVLSVAQMEGLSGNVGDNGTSFGPFQMHIGGANPYSNPQQARQFAESPQGIQYALQHMANAGAKGLQGSDAINAIVRNFERPANPGREVAGAISHYGGSQNLGGGIPGAQGGNGGLAGGFQPPPDNSQMVASLLQAAQSGQGISPQSLLGMATQRQQAGAAVQQFGSAPAANRITQVAQSFLGVPYRWGGSDTSGMDCSAFIQNTYAKLGVKLPRTTYDQAKVGQAVSLDNLQPGDAVFTEPGKIGPKHVGMYIGNGKVQESPHTGDVNKVIPLQNFLSGGFVTARRYINH